MQETKMSNILERIKKTLPDVHAKVRGTIDRQHFLAVLQALTGFGQAIESKSPSQFIENIITLSTHEEGRNCLKSLSTILASAKKWLSFGETYKVLENSSDLDFDKLDVGSLPEIMGVSDQPFFNRPKKTISWYYQQILVCQSTS